MCTLTFESKTTCQGLNQTETKKRNAKVKVECVMRNKQIYALTTNHNLAPLLEQE